MKYIISALIGAVAAYFSFMVVSAKDNESSVNELNSYERLGIWEGKALCKNK